MQFLRQFRPVDYPSVLVRIHVTLAFFQLLSRLDQLIQHMVFRLLLQYSNPYVPGPRMHRPMSTAIIVMDEIERR